MFCCKMNQREFYVNADPLTNSAAFMATTQGKWNHRNDNQMMRGNAQSQKYDNGEQRNGKPVQRFRSRKFKYNPNVTYLLWKNKTCT